MRIGILEALRYCLKRLTAGFRHEDGEDDEREEGQAAEEEVRTVRGAGKKDRGGECDEPVGKLGNSLSDMINERSHSEAFLSSVELRGWEGRTYEAESLRDAITRRSCLHWLYLTCVDLAHDAPGPRVSDTEDKNHDDHDPPAGADVGMHAVRGIEAANDEHAAG